MSSSHELAELAAAEALASSLDVSDSEEEDSESSADESARPETVTGTFPKSLPKGVPSAAHFEAEESRLEIKSTESADGKLTDLFLSVDSGAVRFTQAHVVDVEEEEEEDEDDVQEMEEEDSRRTGSAGDTGAFTGKENIPFCADQRICASDKWIRLRILLSLTFKMPTINYFFCYYFLKVLLHYFPKIKGHKKVTKQ